MLLDLDVAGLGFGVAYGSDFGHRGFTHSLAFAAVVALLGALAHKRLRSGFALAFGFLFLATASRGILDTFTNGGRGVALLWPFSSERFFAPWQVIEVSPIGVSRILTERFATVLESELVWVWLPCLVLGFLFAASRRYLQTYLSR